MEDVYLGDGVYASFDGFQIWLATGDDSNKVVALEPEALKALNGYAKSINEKYRTTHF